MLLCVQAWADLALPDYTSKIVNTGIQAGGIEEVSPVAIRVSTMENLLIFTNEDETILQSYAKTGDIYELKDITKEERKNLNTIIAKPLMMANMLEQGQMEETLKAGILENMPEAQKTVMENRSLIQILKNMPEEKVNELLDTMNQTMDEKLGTMIDQAAISVVKEEYKAIGMNTDKIQNEYIIKIGLQMLGIALISMISAISIMFLSSKVAAHLGKTLREKVFRKVLGFSRRRI